METRNRPPVLDAEVTARRVAAMTLGRSAAHRERLAEQTALLERLADMPLEELSRHVNGRQWMAASLCGVGGDGAGDRPRAGSPQRRGFRPPAAETPGR
jgi:hypothetical protein